jgi:uncharacterized protein (DUF1697 family)
VPKYIAFLRAINVGGHLVKMEKLRSLFEELGFANVETFIASGNVIFDTRSSNVNSLTSKVEKHLHSSLGYPVATFLRSVPEVKNIAKYEPFADSADVHAVYVGFMAAAPEEAATQNLLTFNCDTDEFHVSDREVYWLARVKVSDSKFYGGQLEKLLGRALTLRNSTTVRKLAAKYSS